MRTLFRFLLAIASLSASYGQADPSWWTGQQTQIVDSTKPSSNLSPLNLGQLKYTAFQAKRYFDIYVPGGAGPELAALSASLQNKGSDDFSIANLGQLKSIANPFYSKLASLGYDTRQNLLNRGYPPSWVHATPWDPSTPIEENYLPATLGQLKMTFSFDVTNLFPFVDSDGNGLNDTWETTYLQYVGANPNGDDDLDGFTNLQEYNNGTNPADYYNGKIPQITLVSGDGQTTPPNRFTTQPLKVLVKNEAGQALRNAPVCFLVTDGYSNVSTSRYYNSPLFKEIKLRTNYNGEVQVYSKSHADEQFPNSVKVFPVRYAGTFVMFTSTTSYNLPPAAPTNVTVISGPVVNGQITNTITWQDNSSDENYFVIERSFDGIEWKSLPVKGANVTTATDINPSAGLPRYLYRVSSSYNGE